MKDDSHEHSLQRDQFGHQRAVERVDDNVIHIFQLVRRLGGRKQRGAAAGRQLRYFSATTDHALQNQNPLDPLDTNQFTQQLVEFASVEQQVNMNTNLQTLISMQQTSEATSALQLVGSTVTVGGKTATLSNATSSRPSGTSRPPRRPPRISRSPIRTAFTGTMALNAGAQSFTWNGKGNNGQTWPDGTYTLTVTATGANGQAVNVSTQVQGTVSAVNTNANPPTLTVGGETVQISQVTSISH